MDELALMEKIGLALTLLHGETLKRFVGKLFHLAVIYKKVIFLCWFYKNSSTHKPRT